MSAQSPERIPVIIAIGEVSERPADPASAREPVALMADAFREANADGGGGVIAALDSIDLVGQVTWRYRDPVRLLCERLGISPARAINESMGGETPIRLIHEAALRIARGESRVAAIVGGESLNAAGKARAAGIALDWTPLAPKDETVRLAFSRLPLSPSAKRAGVTDPTHIYPLYENALQSALGQTPADGRAESAALWARYAAVAAGNPNAWMRSAPSAAEIGAVTLANRMIAFPYPKLMVANPSVNQAGAVIVASLAWALDAGIAGDRIIHIHGGSAAQEPGDYLLRDRYDRSTALEAVLERAVVIAGGDAAAIDLAELYSCFPVVPKLALRALGLRADVAPTVAGGLTFFGGPFNNYMTHGVCAMVRALRAGEGTLGLLHGNGGVVSKHHALVLGRTPAALALEPDYSVQAVADARRGPVPLLDDAYGGRATIETWTVIYDPRGMAKHGVVIARTPGGARLIATVPAEDEAGVALLTDFSRSPIGSTGLVHVDAESAMVWKAD